MLPPRVLQGSELSARETLEDICSRVEPFTVTLGEVETFCPLTPTVFIRVAQFSYRLRELHDRLNTQALAAKEEWPYMPHLTIVKMANEREAEDARRIAFERWRHFAGRREVQVRELTFVREEDLNRWSDLAGVVLGRQLVSPRK